jgi:hypothetical protein
MAKQIYWNGILINEKDWDYATKRPKVKKKESPKTEVELLPEVPSSTEE